MRNHGYTYPTSEQALRKWREIDCALKIVIQLKQKGMCNSSRVFYQFSKVIFFSGFTLSSDQENCKIRPTVRQEDVTQNLPESDYQ